MKSRRRPLFGPFIRTLALLAIGAAIAAVALFGNLADLWRGSEDRALALERAKRRAFWVAGQQLPGTPALDRLTERLAERGMKLGAPILVRIFKREFELEIWMHRNGRYEHFATYPICRFSGKLGPKHRTGDKQAPEGFYTVGAGQLNPASRWHRSFNLGFPNAYDRAHGRTGSFLMVHGGCSSVGCYAMTNPVVDEIWQIVTAALAGKQKRFQVQAFPFRMTDENMAEAADRPQAGFWRELKTGHDLFLHSRIPPRVEVCGGSYKFSPGGSGSYVSALPLSVCRQSRRPAPERDSTKRSASR